MTVRTIAIGIDPTRASAGARVVKRDLQGIGQEAGKTERSVKKAGDELDGLGSRVRGVSAVNDNLRQMARAAGALPGPLRAAATAAAALAAVFATLASLDLVRRLIGVADEMTRLTSQLRLVTSSTEELTRAQDQLFGVAQRTRSEFGATVQLYTKLARSTREMGLSQAQLVRITELINKTFVVSGASAEEASNAIRQLAQGLASGALRGDEFNAIAEQAPRLLQVVADAMGKTTGEVRKLAGEGKITAAVLIESLAKSAGKIDEEFGQMAVTVGDSMTVLTSSVERAIGQLDQKLGISSSIANGVLAIAKGVDMIALNIDKVEAAAKAAGLVMALAFGPAMLTMIVGLVQVIGTGLAVAIAGIATALGPVALAIAGLVAAAYYFRDEIKKVFGVDVLDVFQNAANFIINSFEAAYEDVKFVWNNFPTLLAGLGAAAANGFISAIEWMVNTAIQKINELLGLLDTANKSIVDTVNSMFGSDLNYTSMMPQLPEVEFGRFSAAVDEASDALAKHGEKQQMILSQDHFGALREALQGTTSEASGLDDALKNLPTSMGDSGASAEDLAKQVKKAQQELESFRNTADSLVDRYFPAEGAKREAGELQALMGRFGSDLTDTQRRAVELRIQDLNKAASLGLRDLETDVKQSGKDMAESLQSTLGSVLADLFSKPIKDFDDFLNRVMSGFAQLGQQNLQKFFDNLFSGSGSNSGKSGSSGLGGLGGIISSLFGGGMTKTPDFLKTQSRSLTDAAARVSTKPVTQVLDSLGTSLNRTTGILTGNMERYANAIKTMESSGNYGAVGPMTRKGDRAYGAYQVMDFNIPSWTQDALGRSLSINEFLADRVAQDKVFVNQFGKWIDKFGSAQNAASAWLTGRPISADNTSADVNGTTSNKYVARFNKLVGSANTFQDAVSEGTQRGLQAVASAGASAGVGNGTVDNWAGLRTTSSSTITGNAGAATAGAAPGGGLAGVASAALGGLGMGFQSQNPVMGGLGGALSGFAAGGPLGAVVGGIAGIIGGIFGRSRAKKQEQSQARNQLNANKSLISQMFAAGEGRGVGSTMDTYNQFYDQTAEIDLVAQKAGDDELVQKLRANVNSFFLILEKDFIAKLPGSLEAYSSGYGADSPFIQGAQQMEKLREEVKDFVADAKDFGELQLFHNRDLTQDQLNRRVEEAQRAAQAMVLASITGVRELGAMESELLRLEGATSVAEESLRQLGMGAQEAANAVSGALGVAIAKLKDSFLKDMVASLNSLSDVGYLNDIQDAMIAYQQRLADSAALGMDGSLALRELSLSIKDIVLNAKLSKDEIAALSKSFPDLRFILSGINIDTKNLSDATSDLQEAYNKEKSALDSLISRLKTSIDAIKKFRDNMKIGSDSPLSPFDRLVEAAKVFRETSEKAGQGDEDALGNLTSVSQSYLDAAKAYYGSSEGYFKIWTEVDQTLAQTQDLNEKSLTNAEEQLKALDASVAGILDVNDSVLSVKDALDQYNKINAETLANLQQQLQLLAQIGRESITAAYQNSLGRTPSETELSWWQNQVNGGKTVDEVVGSISGSFEAQLNALYKRIFGRNVDTASVKYWQSSGKTMSQIEADLMYAKSQGGFASGGFTGDMPESSVAGVVHGREFVLNAAATRQFRGEAEAMNRGTYSPGDENVAEEVRELRRTVESLRAVVDERGRQNVEATNQATDALRQTRSDQYLASKRRSS